MCEELLTEGNNILSNKAKEVIEEISGIFSNIKKGKLDEKKIRENYVVDFFEIRASSRDGLNKQFERAVEIATKIHANHPFDALIDIVRFPRFLPSPKSRLFNYTGEHLYGEVFLVPSNNPEEWGRRSEQPKFFPLHMCDFSKIEENKENVARVTIIALPPEGGKERGNFISRLFKEACRIWGIKISGVSEY